MTARPAIHRVTQIYPIIALGFLLTTLGVALGVAGAVVVNRLMQILLFDVTAIDPSTFVAVALLRLLTGMFRLPPAGRPRHLGRSHDCTDDGVSP